MSGEVKMKPKWYFVLGSAFWLLGVAGLFIGATFAMNLLLFIVRKRGPGIRRLEIMFDSFPAWLPIVAILCIILGATLLKKYDFSYKKNFKLIIAGLIITVMASALALDASGLNEAWSKRGPFKDLYQGQYRFVPKHRNYNRNNPLPMPPINPHY